MISILFLKLKSFYITALAKNQLTVSRLFITCFALFFLSISISNAQRLRGEDPRVKKELLLLFGENYGDEEQMFSSVDVPEKWRNASAVILGQKMDYKYLRKGRDIGIYEAVRKRIKIQDKASLEELSEFFFAKDALATFKIIKANGTEVEIDLADAKDVNVKIPWIYRAYYNKSFDYRKLAIPGLEVGDILDYTYFTADNADSTYPKELHTFIFTLASTYPIASQLFEFTVDRGLYLSCNTYNGAEKLSEKENDVDLNGRQRESISTFKLADSDRDALPNEIWSYDYLELPFVKFRVVSMPNKYTNTTSSLIGNQGEVKMSVSKEELAERSRTLLNDPSVYVSDVSKEMAKDIKKNHPELKDPEAIAEFIYYTYQSKVFGTYFSLESSFREEPSTVKVDVFLQVMHYTMKALAIETEIVVMMPKFLGNIDDILLDSEVAIGIRVKGSEHVIFPFSNFSNYQYTNPTYSGTDAVAVSKDGFVDFKIETSTSDMNYINRSIKASIADDYETFNFEKRNSVAGVFKDSYSEVVLSPLTKKYIADGNKGIEAVEEKIKELNGSNYDIEAHQSIEPIQDGRTAESDVLIYDEVYTVKGLLSKAGPNYVIEIGKMLDSQIQLDQNDLQPRKMDVHFSSAKSFSYKIELAIPDGYYLDGLDQLNKSSDNKYGSFTSNAKVEGNSFILEAKKVYKSDFIPKEDWTSAYSFLEAAYDLSQAKVVLKKK